MAVATGGGDVGGHVPQQDCSVRTATGQGGFVRRKRHRPPFVVPCGSLPRMCWIGLQVISGPTMGSTRSSRLSLSRNSNDAFPRSRYNVEVGVDLRALVVGQGEPLLERDIGVQLADLPLGELVGRRSMCASYSSITGSTSLSSRTPRSSRKPSLSNIVSCSQSCRLGAESSRNPPPFSPFLFNPLLDYVIFSCVSHPPR